MIEIPFPLMSEDGDWFAFPDDWSRYQVASELAHNHLDWWLSESGWVWIDDNDKTHGWFTAYRDLIRGIRRGHIRPQSRLEDGDYYRELDDWYHECGPDHPSARKVWIWAA